VTFYGTKEGSDRQKLEQFTIKGAEETEITLDFNMIVKANKLTGFKKLEIGINSSQQLLLLIQFNDVEKHEMDVEEQSFFSLKKGENLTYSILGNKNASEEDIINITTLVGSSVDINQSVTPCKYSSGCTVTITAKDDTSTILTTALNRK